MAGLVLKLAPGESFIVNGALLENGDKPTRFRVKDNNARVIRCSDAMKPEEVDSATKRLYYAIQLIITGDLDEEETVPALLRECVTLQHVFETIDADLFPVLRSMISRGNYYSALCHMRQIIELESKVIAYTEARAALSEKQVA